MIFKRPEYNWYVETPDGQIRGTNDINEWDEYFKSPERIVAQTQVTDEIEVSTVFLGIDHRHFGTGPPIVYETMIFGGPRHEECERYETREQAKRGHERILAELREELKTSK